jgi:CRISPR-associated endonuclease/helicase Cas3
MNFWGKANAEDGTWHPLVYHMLDVAAVAGEWLENDRDLCNLFQKLSGIPENSLIPALTIASAYHDIGKATVYFQNKFPDLAKKNDLYWQTAAEARGFDHGAFGCLWIDEWREDDSIFQDWSADYPFLHSEAFLNLWRAACWHHGRALIPTDYLRLAPVDNKASGKGNVFDTVMPMRNSLLQIITTTIDPKKHLSFDVNHELSPSFLRLFAGFVSVCDWLGSDEECFSIVSFGKIEEYWQHARKQAMEALSNAQLISGENIPSISAISEILGKNKSPRPVQKALDVIKVMGTSLVIVEAPTGEGKTESAFFQFARNQGRGFYFGLPTQASANQISGRIKHFLKDNLKTSERAILAHGNAWLVKAIAEEKRYDSHNSSLTDTTAESELSDWFNSKKRTLLSHYGVGTVDQAMLAALNVKHGFVKLFGLAGKTLIIDEVHAYDSFMLPILEHLLRWCGFLNTSVVLLSATLPSHMKKRLISAYLNDDNTESRLQKNGYPLLTIANKENDGNANIQEIDSIHGKAMETRKKESITISFATHTKDDISLIADQIIAKIKDGGNVLWICNTVNKAQLVFNELKRKNLNSTEIRLFHSRYTKSDRLDIEKDIESLYGDESKSPTRPVRSILVATQVAEQSLDIDFDFLITDIAPVDLILQRAGRIFRHDRGNRNPGFKKSEILLLVPSEIKDIKNFAGVYDQFSVLKTMYELSILPEATIILPNMYRSLVENVYNESIPDCQSFVINNITLKIENSIWKDALKKQKDKTNELDLKGRQNLIPLPTNEYPVDSALLSEEDNSYWSAKTRDGEESLGLILVNFHKDKYFIGNRELSAVIPEKIEVDLLIQMSLNTVEVSSKYFIHLVRKKDVLQPDENMAASWQKKLDKTSILKGKKLLILNESGQVALDFSKAIYKLIYSRQKGLELNKMD